MSASDCFKFTVCKSAFPRGIGPGIPFKFGNEVVGSIVGVQDAPGDPTQYLITVSGAEALIAALRPLTTVVSMSGTVHSPTPWEGSEGYEQETPGYFVSHARGGIVVSGMDPVTRGDRDRIVACVNAMEGVRDPAALRKALDEFFEDEGRRGGIGRIREAFGVPS